jgi:hypothetical protein
LLESAGAEFFGAAGKGDLRGARWSGEVSCESDFRPVIASISVIVKAVAAQIPRELHSDTGEQLWAARIRRLGSASQTPLR